MAPFRRDRISDGSAGSTSDDAQRSTIVVSWRLKLCPTVLGATVAATLAVAFVAGVGSVLPLFCHAGYFVAATLAIAISAATVALRPFRVAVRNFAGFALEFPMLVGALVLGGVLIAGNSGGAVNSAAVTAGTVLLVVPASVVGPALAAVAILRVGLFFVGRVIILPRSLIRRQLASELDAAGETMLRSVRERCRRRREPGKSPSSAAETREPGTWSWFV